MRLLCLTNLFPDTTQAWRGLDNVTLLHALRALDPALDIRVLCLRPGHGFWTGKACGLKPRPGDEALHPSYHWTPYVPKFGGMNDRLYALAVRRALKSLPAGWKPDALLVPWLFPDACGVHRVPELKGVPLLTVAQGSDVHQYLNLPMRRRAILSLCQRAHVITRSEDLRQRLLRAGAAADHVSTVYNGVDIETFRPGDKVASRKYLGLPLGPKILLFVGNFLPVKGLDLLIQSAAALHEELPLHLVLIGSGPLEGEMRSLCQSSGLGDVNVTFAGRKGPAEVAQYMRAVDAVCLSSHNEGVPNVLLESFASGRPLVTTHVGGISEITQPSPRGGFLVQERVVAPYVQALKEALLNPPDEQTLSAYTRPFSWPQCAGAYWKHLFALRQKIGN
ncbi:Glycosyltransferase involved in cell wall bisynthesis [Prosthecobacter debontii]|uniref:Glycosyltransferase involved in cell wall bisynthesis n=1 Tax=Prosthecobacter debontii TaxID=48467 RepID=A0A1T4WI64_9BACT|nr:glycosyltransferase [Prosthecobacter debontii]SKA77023.1 Glycosyltransferase involved in cell wall bisynthesis [Prosthecobacter debontii]